MPNQTSIVCYKLKIYIIDQSDANQLWSSSFKSNMSYHYLQFQHHHAWEFKRFAFLMDQISWCKFFALIIGCWMYMINPRRWKFKNTINGTNILRFFKHTSVECRYIITHMHKNYHNSMCFIVQFGYDKL